MLVSLVLMYQFFILGWSKCPFWFFCTLRETFFIFTNNFIDLDILSMSAISCYWLLVCRGQGYNQTSSNPKDSSTAKCYLAKMSIVWETSQTTFDMFNQSQHLLYTLHKSFIVLHFSCVFTFLAIIKQNTPKKLSILFHLWY